MSNRQFAIEASNCLRQVAHDLCRDNSYVQFCASLEATLSNIIAWLQTLPDNEDSQREANDLLSDLRSLCQTPIHPEQSGITLEGFESCNSTLVLLLKDPSSTKLAIQSLACDKALRRKRQRVLTRLEQYLQQEADGKVDVSPSNADLQALSEDPPECGREIASLYKTLYTHCFCNQSGEVGARIRLRSNSPKDGRVTFGVLFKAHPHHDRDDLHTQPWWQDTRISISRTVTFKGSKTSELQEVGLDPEMPFCSYISAQEEEGLIELYFNVTGGKLYFEEGQDPTRHWELDRPSISLGCLLEEVSKSTDDLTEKRKEVLSWLLAKAVWQYYSSPWMVQPWTKETVHFLFERRQSDLGNNVTGIFLNEPLLSVLIAPDPSKEDESKKPLSKVRPSLRSRGPLQQVPKIVNLGIMLVEIQLGRSIESLYGEPEWSTHCPGGKPNPSTNYNICRDLIRRPTFFADGDISDPLEALIKKCLEPKDVFMPPHVRDEDGIREILYNLVNHLEVYVSIRKPHNIKPLNLPSFSAQYRVSRMPSPFQVGPARGVSSSPQLPPKATSGKQSWPGRTMAAITNSTSTKGWFKRMDSFNYILKASDGDAYDKVKIAVLDTGVSPLDAAADYISGYKDFVSGDDSVKSDNTGHGTTSVNLIFDMCESAEVYAVRIFETDEANENTREIAIKAIGWCISEKMDVVCMACGFQGFDQDLYEKIHDASGKMLIFAAPTNESNVSEIAYPARHNSEVFCTFSTNGAINTSRRLNPTAGLEGYNFAILGEGIKTFAGEEKSGTSFSTAIAAGLASRLLDFSKHSDCQETLSKHASVMKVKHGMTKVLLAMSIADAGFRCLKPWQLLPKELRCQIPFDEYGLPTEIARKLARAHVCSMIHHSLDEDLGFR